MPLGTPRLRSRDGLPYRDELPENVRREPAKWVQPRGRRRHSLSADPPFVSWRVIVRIDSSDNCERRTN